MELQLHAPPPARAGSRTADSLHHEALRALVGASDRGYQGRKEALEQDRCPTLLRDELSAGHAAHSALPGPHAMSFWPLAAGPAAPPPSDPTFGARELERERKDAEAKEAAEAKAKSQTALTPGEFAGLSQDTAAEREAAVAAAEAAEVSKFASTHPPEFSESAADRQARAEAEAEAKAADAARAEALAASRSMPPEFRPTSIASRLADEEAEYDPDESLSGTPRSDVESPTA